MWMPYRLFPYERRLGIRELEGLGLTVLDTTDDGVTVVGDVESAAARPTYFDHFVVEDSDRVVSAQSVIEAAHMEGRPRNAVRQATRYGLHGIHEYKGK